LLRLLTLAVLLACSCGCGSAGPDVVFRLLLLTVLFRLFVARCFFVLPALVILAVLLGHVPVAAICD